MKLHLEWYITWWHHSSLQVKNSWKEGNKQATSKEALLITGILGSEMFTLDTYCKKHSFNILEVEIFHLSIFLHSPQTFLVFHFWKKCLGKKMDFFFSSRVSPLCCWEHSRKHWGWGLLTSSPNSSSICCHLPEYSPEQGHPQNWWGPMGGTHSGPPPSPRMCCMWCNKESQNFST